MIYAATGHRPKYFKGPHIANLHDLLTGFAMEAIQARDIELMITGMAEGWDLAVADACLQLQIPYIAAVPFVGQERLWSGRSQERYRKLCDVALSVEVISPHRLNVAYEIRDEWMVDKAAMAGGRLLALYSGVPSGTGKTVQYAHDWCVPVENVWDQWASRWQTADY